MAPMTSSTHGQFQFTVPVAEVSFEASKDRGRWVMRGHAAVFNRKSHDLGGFRTVIAPTAFDKILDTSPDVHLLWDHDTRYVLARTKNKSLELRVDPYGLHVWAKFAKTVTAEECATLMEGGFIDQMSFACDIGSDEWVENAEGITRTIHEVDALYDVTVCAQGAFPQTDAQLVASLKDAGADLASAQEAGRVIRREDPDLAATHGSAEKQEGEAHPGAVAEGEAHPGAVADTAANSDRLAELREWAEARFTQNSQP